MPLTPLELIKIGFVGFLTVDFYRYARSGKARRHFTVFLGWSWQEWGLTLLRVLGGLIGVLILISLFWGVPLPVMRFSWLNLLATPADGPDPGTNLMVSGAQIPWFALLFVPLLALNMPRLARREEELFRRGTQPGLDAWLRCLKFGFIHMIVGVPVAAALALVFVGWVFTWRYWIGGLRDAAFHHTLHNFFLLALLSSFLLF